MILKIRNRITEKEAIRYDGSEESFEEIQKFVDKKLIARRDTTIVIPTLEGVMEAQPFDWIIKGLKGEFYPCKPDIFEKSYEIID